MPIYLHDAHSSQLSIPVAPLSLRRSPRGLWPGLLLGVLTLGLLGLSLLALLGMFGLIIGLQALPMVSSPPAVAQPTALVVVIPSAAPASVAMPAPAVLEQVAAAPLPTTGPPAPLPPVAQMGALAQEQPPLPQRSTQQVITYADLFRTAGEQTGIDWRLLAALAYRESRMDPSALGRDGDMGLMQILPATWDEFAPGAAAVNPFDPRQNVQVSAAYLIYLQDYLRQWQTNDLRWLLTAYNWGPDNVRRLLASGGRWEDVPPVQQRYVADILYAAFGAEK